MISNERGAFSFVVRPLQNTTYRVTWAGTEVLRAANPAVADVAVRPTVTLSLSHPTIKKNKPLYSTGTYVPSLAGVALQIQRKEGKVWIPLQNVTTRADGSYVGKWFPRKVGTFYLRTVRVATDTLGGAVTPVRKVVVTK